MIDTHVHLWDPRYLRYPWLDEIDQLNKPYLIDDYLRACGQQKPEGIVFVQAGTMADDFLGEAEWVAAMELPLIKGIVAGASMEEGDGVREHLLSLSKIDLVKGVRRLIQSEPDDAFCILPEFIEGIKCLPEFGFTFDICIYHRQLDSAIKLVEACPDVRFILDHLGKPGVKAGLMEPWKEEIEEMASHNNVVCKLSGLITEADHDRWELLELLPYVEHVISCFGSDRILFGTDWPVVELAQREQTWFSLLDEMLGSESVKMWEKMSANARRIYQLDD